MTDSTSPASEAVERHISGLLQDLLDKDDRNSPQDQPEMLLITAEELVGALRDVLQYARALTPSPPQPAPPADAREAVFTELRSRKLLKYLFAPIPADERDYGYLDAPFDITIQHEIVDALIAATFVSTDARENAVDGERLFRCFMAGDTNLLTSTAPPSEWAHLKPSYRQAWTDLARTLSRKDASPQPERRPVADLEKAAHEFKAHWHYGPDPADVYDHALRAAFVALGITFEEPDPA